MSERDWPPNWRSDGALGPRIDGIGRSELEREVYAARRYIAVLRALIEAPIDDEPTEDSDG